MQSFSQGFQPPKDTNDAVSNSVQTGADFVSATGCFILPHDGSNTGATNPATETQQSGTQRRHFESWRDRKITEIIGTQLSLARNASAGILNNPTDPRILQRYKEHMRVLYDKYYGKGPDETHTDDTDDRKADFKKMLEGWVDTMMSGKYVGSSNDLADTQTFAFKQGPPSFNLLNARTMENPDQKPWDTSRIYTSPGGDFGCSDYWEATHIGTVVIGQGATWGKQFTLLTPTYNGFTATVNMARREGEMSSGSGSRS
jgi:hypothetical protein